MFRALKFRGRIKHTLVTSADMHSSVPHRRQPQPCKHMHAHAKSVGALGDPSGNWKASAPAPMPCFYAVYSCKTPPSTARRRQGLAPGRILRAMHILWATVYGSIPVHLLRLRRKTKGAKQYLGRPANGLRLNGFNGLSFQVGALWMGENELIYLVGWVGSDLIENWVGWVGIGFFCGFEWVEPMGWCRIFNIS
jgi:hypothetical protein